MRRGVADPEPLTAVAYSMRDSARRDRFALSSGRREQPAASGRLARNLVKKGKRERRQRYAMRQVILRLLGWDVPDVLVEVDLAPLGADDLAFALCSAKLKLKRQSYRR